MQAQTGIKWTTCIGIPGNIESLERGTKPSYRNAFDHVGNAILTKRGDASARDRLHTLFPSEDYLDKYDFTLLHETVLGLNNLDLTTLLVSLPKTTFNKGDNDNRTAAWWAAIRGDFSSLSLLVKHGADINKASRRGNRPLDIAIEYNRLACAELLIDSGHNVTYSDLSGWTPLHVCCYSSGSVGIAERLISKGAKIDACTLEGERPLHVASQENNEEFVKCLISHGASLNITDTFGDSPLHYAIKHNSPQALQILLQNHADCSLRTKAGETLLHLAAQISNIQCLAILRLHDLSCINIHDRITSISHSQTLKGVIGLTALEVARRRLDVTPEWLDVFQKLVHEIEFPEQRSSTDFAETEDFQDALESQD